MQHELQLEKKLKKSKQGNKLIKENDSMHLKQVRDMSVQNPFEAICGTG